MGNSKSKKELNSIKHIPNTDKEKLYNLLSKEEKEKISKINKLNNKKLS